MTKRKHRTSRSETRAPRTSRSDSGPSKQTSTYQGSLYSQPSMLALDWKYKVVAELRRLAVRADDPLLVDLLERRAKAFSFCGYPRSYLNSKRAEYLWVRHRRAFPCNARCCPFCQARVAYDARQSVLSSMRNLPSRVDARVRRVRKALRTRKRELKARIATTDGRARDRASGALQKVRDQLADVDEVATYRWFRLDLTAPYAPKDPVSYSDESIQGRARGFVAAIREIWASLLLRPAHGCTALVWFLDFSAAGCVHLHAAYFGPELTSKRVQRVGRKAFPGLGKVEVEAAWDNDPEGWLLYIAGPLMPMPDEWKAGRPAKVIAPELAARWEAATACRAFRMHGRCGLFHGRTGKA